MSVMSQHMRLSATPPRRLGRGKWVSVFSFKLYLMQVRIMETYQIDELGLITQRACSILHLRYLYKVQHASS